MDYKVYKIFDTDLNKLTTGLKVAQCMGSSSEDLLLKAPESTIENKLEDLCISEKLVCSFCNTTFEDQIQQRLHYKLDWHRYNLKQKLNEKKSVSEEKFSQLADDLSSISGSESSSEDDDDDDSSDSIPSSAAKLASSQSSETVKSNEHLQMMAARHAKVFFENVDGKILSLYRCLLHGKKDVPEKDEQLISLALNTMANPMWAIIMLGGGHFAAGIFQGSEVLVHKTFHCYTVRARQGGAQSSRDGRSGGSHPKSAGASLRRYNEAALIQHVQEIMDTWSSQLNSCGLILYRAVGQNRNVLFSGRNPPLNKADPRLRTIPFATRRATFSEVKRVHDILAGIEVYGSAASFQTDFPQSPRKRGCKSQTVVNENVSVDSINQLEGIETLNLDHNQQFQLENNVDGEVKEESTGPKGGKGKNVIDRAKARKSPHRPLPGIVTAILAKSSSESDVSESCNTLSGHLVAEDIEISFENLLEFEDTVPQELKDKKKSKDFKKGKKKPVEKELNSSPVISLHNKLLAACRLGDTTLLVSSLEAAQKMQEGNSVTDQVKPLEESECSTKKKQVECEIITQVEFIKCLNEGIGESKETLLHVAAHGGHMDIVRILMEAGCDPCVKNKKSQTPYIVSANKETRNIFRRFLAEFPDKYDYSKSQIPGPLTDEMEQKMAEKRREQKKVKRGREKERKKEEDARREEETEKERFLRLSDREKRALAAERRQISQGVVKPAVSRCFQCAVDITGKVPFEYDVHRFCTIGCLKEHRLKIKNLQQKQ